ncbi:hypothetical protein J6590_079871 [Homalodisca vitripennis]|nr:hypothetical protein J6590_079871 [Homalodisca vitripennis]
MGLHGKARNQGHNCVNNIPTCCEPDNFDAGYNVMVPPPFDGLLPTYSSKVTHRHVKFYITELEGVYAAKAVSNDKVQTSSTIAATVIPQLDNVTFVFALRLSLIQTPKRRLPHI